MAWDLQASPIDEDACRHIAQVASEIYAYGVTQSAVSRRAVESAAVLDAATVRLEGMLQTLDLEETTHSGS